MYYIIIPEIIDTLFLGYISSQTKPLYSGFFLLQFSLFDM
jgi:hypothetical protein